MHKAAAGSLPNVTQWFEKSLAQLVALGTLSLEHSSESAKLDCQILLAKAIDKPTTYLFTWPEYVASHSQINEYHQLMQRRINGEPIAYIVGEKEFWSMMFEVAPSTLIPRPDTEVLVEKVLTDIEQFPPAEQATNNQCRLLDLGTGTGAIALALASELPNWQVEAIDFNQDAVALAKRNAKRHQLTHVNIRQSDWFSSIEQGDRYQVIVSNPPYIDEQDQHLSQGDVRFEPDSALTSPQNGLADIKLIVEQAQQYLVSGGWLYLEHGYDQGQQVRDIFAQFAYHRIETTKDYGDNDRVTFAMYLKK